MIPKAKPTEPLDAALAELQRLGLEGYAAELDARGFSVIPPEIADPDGLHLRLRDACLDVAERRNGVRPDLETGATHVGYRGRLARGGGDSPFGENFPALIHEGRVFEEAILNPVLLAMTTYMLGYSHILSSMGCLIKGPNESPLEYHSDLFLPPPWPSHALLCNATYILTDYDLAAGPLCFVPGSHKLCRGPYTDEKNPETNPRTHIVEAPAGSMAVWHGNTWHGACHRTSTGLRMAIPVLMARPYMRTEEDLHGKFPQEVLDRNPTRFAILTQHGIGYGWDSYEDSLTRNKTASKLNQKYFEETGGLPNQDLFDYENNRLHG